MGGENLAKPPQTSVTDVSAEPRSLRLPALHDRLVPSCSEPSSSVESRRCDHEHDRCFFSLVIETLFLRVHIKLSYRRPLQRFFVLSSSAGPAIPRRPILEFPPRGSGRSFGGGGGAPEAQHPSLSRQVTELQRRWAVRQSSRRTSPTAAANFRWSLLGESSAESPQQEGV